jgi:hypothetical protein
VPVPLARHHPAGNLAELGVNQRNQLVERCFIA